MSVPKKASGDKSSAARNKQAVPEWQSWEKSTLDRRFRIFTIVLAVLAVPMIGAILYMARNVFIDRTATASRRPSINNSRAPELLQPFSCDLKSGMQVSQLRTFLRNVGNADARTVIPTVTLHLMPQRPVGNPAFDQLPNNDCKDKPFVPGASLLVAAGKDYVSTLMPPSVLMPPLLTGETVQLFAESCAYYSDAGGTDRSICDTYRFRLDSGAEAFQCDGTPKSGKFDPASVTNCGN